MMVAGALLGAAGGTGIAGLVWSTAAGRKAGAGGDRSIGPKASALGSATGPRDGGVGASERRRARLRTLICALVPAGVTALVTRWPVAAILAGAAGAFVPHLFGATAGDRATERVEGVASWAEILRDALAASAGLGQAIVTSAPIAPRVIRPAVMTLAARVEAGVPLGQALRMFAAELEEPGADLVIAALVLATEQRAQKVGDLLGALAVAAREEVSVRLRVEASRAQIRTGVRVVAGFSIGFAGFLLLVARGYLSPFGSPGGQMALAGVGLLYAGGLAVMVRMARPEELPRLALAAVTPAEGASRERRTVGDARVGVRMPGGSS